MKNLNDILVMVIEWVEANLWLDDAEMVRVPCRVNRDIITWK
jgi:hypothetical protein